MAGTHPDSTRAAALARLAAGERAAIVAAELGVGLRTLRRWEAAGRRPRARRSATLRVRSLARELADLDRASPERLAEFACNLDHAYGLAAYGLATDAGDLRGVLRGVVRLLSLRARLLPLCARVADRRRG